jgi:sporulation protein YlmC with PRC-barrel domain
VRLSNLQGVPVRTESGRDLGRLHDLRAELRPRSAKIIGIVVGRAGLLERLGIGAPTSADRIRTRTMIAWRDVVRADRRGVVVRDAAAPE